MAFIQDQNQLALRRQALMDAAEKNIGGAIEKYADYRQKEADKQAAIDLAMRKAALETDAEKAKEESRRIFELDKQGKELAAKATQEDLNRKNELEKARIAAQGKGNKSTTSESDSFTGGQKVPAGQAAILGETEAALSNLKEYSNILNTSDIPKGKVQGLYSGALGTLQAGETGKKAASLMATRDASAQVIGSFLEGGKLTDSDFERYKKMLPSYTDDQSVINDKVQALNKLINNKRESQLKGLQQFGFNVPKTGQQPMQPIQPTQGLTREQKIEAIRKSQGL